MNYLYLESVDSTNSFAKNNLSKIQDKTAIYTYNQTQGRGRIGHTWDSEKGKNIACSYVFKNVGTGDISFVTFAVAKAVREFLVQLFGQSHRVNIQIKWPNDIFADGLKICGILCENVSYGSDVCDLIVGIGINVNQRNFDSAASGYKATSLSLITGDNYYIFELISRLSLYVENEISSFFNSCDKSYLIKYLNENLYGVSAAVLLEDGRTGNLIKISDAGGAIIEINGDFTEIISGEIKFTK